MTVSKCLGLCSSFAFPYKYAGLAGGHRDQCFCGNTLNTGPSDITNPCTAHCSGARNEYVTHIAISSPCPTQLTSRHQDVRRHKHHESLQQHEYQRHPNLRRRRWTYGRRSWNLSRLRLRSTGSARSDRCILRRQRQHDTRILRQLLLLARLQACWDRVHAGVLLWQFLDQWWADAGVQFDMQHAL